MKKIVCILISVAVFLSVFSCNKTEVQEEGYGYLYAHIDEDFDEDLVFKSNPGEDLVFSLTVYNSLGQEQGHVDDYRTLAQSPMALPAGNFDYTAVASSGSDGAAAFDEPFYSGQAVFRVAKDEVSNIDITCSLANVKVTTSFSDDIRENFSSYRLTVSNGLGELVFDSEDGTIGKEGYFSVTGTLTWTLSLVNTDGQVYAELTDTYTDVKAKQHYNLSFSLGTEDEFGGGALTVILDDSMDEKEYDLVLDFGDNTVPQMTADFDFSEPVYVTAGDAAERNFTLSSEDGFESIRLTYGSADALTKAAGETYELVGAGTDVMAALAADGISVDSVSEGAGTVNMNLTNYVRNLAVGDYSINIFMVDVNHVFTEASVKFSVQSAVDVEAVSANPWARFVTVEAKWFPAAQPEGLSFQYRKQSDAAWTDFAGKVTVNGLSRTYSAEIRGLEPETEYVLRAVTAEDRETKSLSFTTEAEGTVPNMNFDSWYQDGSVWYPNLDADNFYWDTANGGTKTLSIYPTTPAEPENVYGGANAAKLESKEAMLVGLAAGNIYTGKFIKAVMSFTDPGAELDWGVPFTSRPLALTGYFKYSPVTVNKGDHNSMSGKTDIGQIQIMLTDWDAPFRVSTASGKFVDPNTDQGIIAYGTLDLNGTSSYEQFKIELDYRDLTRIPKYIVIVAAASKYGDYFTGGVGSTLYLDEFEFVYDPDQLD